MSIRYMNAVWQNKSTSGSMRLVLLSLADNASDDGICWPSFDTIADRCNLSKRQVIRMVNSLKQDGLITVKHRANDAGLFTSNIYQLDLQAIACSDTHDTTIVSPMTLRSDTHDTRGSVAHVTRVVSPMSLKPSFNHHIEPPINQARLHKFSSLDVNPMLSRVVGLSAIPPTQMERVEQIVCMVEAHSQERVEAALKDAADRWKKTKNKNGRPYPVTNMAWVDWAQEELDGGADPPVTFAVWDTWSDDKKREWINAGKEMPL